MRALRRRRPRLLAAATLLYQPRLCPLCEEQLLQMGALWLCGWCGFRIGAAEPMVSRGQVQEATRRFLAQGGRITRLPDGPGAEQMEMAEEEAPEEQVQADKADMPVRGQETEAG